MKSRNLVYTLFWRLRTPRTDYWKPTGGPQTMPIVEHSLDNTKRHTMMSMTHPTTVTQPTSCVGGANPPSHNQQPFTTDNLSSSQTVSAILPGSSRTGLGQAIGGVWLRTLKEGTPTPYSRHIASKAQLQAQLEASKPLHMDD